jgi:peptidoglycan/xylan/chitin deacetylase (PgdA/CDA1 family)
LDKKAYRIYIRPTCQEVKAYQWIWGVFSDYLQLDYSFCLHVQEADFIVGDEFGDHIRTNENFWSLIREKKFDYSLLLDDQMYVRYSDNSIDFFSTAFYFINCLWEKSELSVKDKWGRSEFSNSIWKFYGYEKPFSFVNQLFEDYASQLSLDIPHNKSKVFLSHDIDTIYGAIVEDTYCALKQRNIFQAFKVIFENVFRGPQWKNFKSILELEKKYAMFSTFFWLPIKGKVKGIGKNADYNINTLDSAFNLVEQYGGNNGIHKSISSYTFKEELKMLSFNPIINRNHYLKYTWEELQEEIDNSELKMDASLGYAEAYGYRNGYSLPFTPFDINRNKAYGFVEVPLTIMDGTFSKYLKNDAETAFLKLEKFIEENKLNGVISILWHNSHFTNYKYKGYKSLYEKLLKKCNELQINSISPQQIYGNYKIRRQ